MTSSPGSENQPQPGAPAPPEGVPHRRRPRYSGKNPRRFAEKYKEHGTTTDPDTVAKVIASGKTPAGSHRPILVNEILEHLDPSPGQHFVDCTLGFGGHALAILPRLVPGGMLLGLDADPIELPKTEDRLRSSGWRPEQFRAVRTNFAALPRELAACGWMEGADGILADLGVSSMQLDDPSRGFSFREDGPLDLRLNPLKGLSAAAWIAGAEESEIARVLREYSDEPNAELLASALVQARQKTPMATTRQLFDVISSALSKGRRLPPEQTRLSARRVFQALRIQVNDEFGVLELWLRQLPSCLRPGGRVAVLTFHSGEDRRVKHAFQTGLRSGLYSECCRDVIRPSPDEIRSNTRASSAKLRWAIRAK